MRRMKNSKYTMESKIKYAVEILMQGRLKKWKTQSVIPM